YKPGAETPPNNLLVLEVPIDYTIMFQGTPVKFFGDYAHNFDADARARKFGRPDLANQDNAFQLGVQYGDAKKKGQWDARAFYQETQIFAVDTNLVDPDIFDSRANLKGLILQAHYAIANGAQVGVTLARGTPVDSSVITPGSSGDTLAQNVRWDNYSLAQFDLVVKF
ncbi:MAG TPA: putative porin, partial [Opitutaceae bacterium]